MNMKLIEDIKHKLIYNILWYDSNIKIDFTNIGTYLICEKSLQLEAFELKF